ncbi:RES family NAD+ phosphorylase [Chryseobacterium sp. TY3]
MTIFVEDHILIIDIFTFIDNDLLEELIIHHPFIQKLEQELAKPHRRSDSDLDYLPTQYISEFIKSMGYDGIEFQSAQNKEGYNLAVFYPEKFECENTEVVEVVELDLKYISI